MFLRRSLASLARAYKLLFFSVGTFGGLAPPNTKKLATLVIRALLLFTFCSQLAFYTQIFKNTILVQTTNSFYLLIMFVWGKYESVCFLE